MMDMSLCHLPLRPSSLETLQKAGYVGTAELIMAKEKGGIATLAAELQVSSHVALSIYHEVIEALNRNNNGNNDNNGHNKNSNMMMTAKSILDQRQPHSGHQHTRSNGHILTFCRDLDQILGGGIPLGQVSEIVGPPGSGKTLLATQLAVNVSLPPIFGGVNGHTIYIDTEGSFAPERAYTLADHLIRHIRAGVERRQLEQQPQQQQPHHDHQQSWQATPEDILARITVYRAHSVADLVAVLDVLEGNDNDNDDDDNNLRLDNCRLIVIDSIALPFRSIPPDVARTRLLASVAARLTQWATIYDLAVVCINQRTTERTGLAGGTGGGGGTAALGATWGHAVANRLSVNLSSSSPSVANNSNDANTSSTPFASSSTKREAILVKSARMPIATAEFQVTEAGIRGLDYVDHKSSSSTSSASASSSHHRKKPKFGT
jgi:RecA/RadA recombinase